MTKKIFITGKNVYCEGELSFLLDSIQRPYSYQGSIGGLFKKFIDNHNAQLMRKSSLKLGLLL